MYLCRSYAFVGTKSTLVYMHIVSTIHVIRAEGKIKHCRIRKEGRLYCIGDAEVGFLYDIILLYELR